MARNEDRDDFEPRGGRPVTLGEDLDPLSVEDLEVRIAQLREEIRRVEVEFAKKRAHQSKADTIFKGSP